jgi:iron(III) transport system substrate-binding protein
MILIGTILELSKCVEIIVRPLVKKKSLGGDDGQIEATKTFLLHTLMITHHHHFFGGVYPMLKFIRVLLVFSLFVGIFAVLSAQDDDAGFLNIYSSRHYGDLEAPFAAFTEATGIEVRVSAGSPRDLLSRLRADISRGDRSVADVFLAIDAGVLSLATEEGLLQPVESDILTNNVAENFRDPDNHWFGLSIRTRTLVYNPVNVTDDEIAMVNNYSDLADPMWEGRLCMRPASHIYTVSLFSSILYHLGEEEATSIAEGIANNVTRYINSDTSQIRAVVAGECDLALVNHYYMGRLGNGDDDARATFDSVELKWMNQETTGVFFNINGAGIVRNAANYDNAVLFLEFMTSLENQCGDTECFPGSNFEFPTNPEAELETVIAGFGEFEYDLEYALWEYGQFQEASVEMLEQANFGFTEN